MASKFWVGGTGTWDNVTTTHWSLSSGGAGGAAVPTTGDTVTFDGSSGGGTVSVDATVSGLSLASITMGAFIGTLDFSFGNPSLTITSTFSITGTATRTLNLGSGTFTFTLSNGTAWDATTTTGLTFNAGTSTLLSGGDIGLNSSRGFTFNSLTYSTVTINAPTTRPQQPVSFNSSPTIGTLNINGPGFINLGAAQTLTVTNLNITGSSSNPVTLNGGGTIQTTTIAVSGSAAITWAALHQIVFSGIAVNATNSFDLKGNTMNGGAITAPSGNSGGVFGS